MRTTILLLVLTVHLFLPNQATGLDKWSSSDLTTLEQPAKQMMEKYLIDIIDMQFFSRDSLLQSLKTVEDWDRRIAAIRDSVVSWTGPFPERTPLNARITGRIEHDDYTIEKVLFESRRDFYVSANLYLPHNISGRRPAVLNVIGHYAEGKSAAHVQRRCIAQAQKGFVALVIDGIGQGDRQMYDYTHHSKDRPLASNMPGGVHKTIGLQAILSGTHSFNIMAWDVIRAVDYLVSRPEVDPEQIAITGVSGGGMMSTYILPLEPRIKVSIPGCNPSNYLYHVHRPSGSDHENIFFGQAAARIDMRGDPLFTHIPKPLLINATTDDQLNPPRGVWDLDSWLYRAYAAYDAPHKFRTSMTQGPHGYYKPQREVAYAWLLQWMGGDPADFQEENATVESEEDLWCTPGSDVSALPNSKGPHDVVTAYMNEHLPAWEPIQTLTELNKHRTYMLQAMQSILCNNPEVAPPQFDMDSSRYTETKKITPVKLRPEQGIVLPGVFIESTIPYPDPKQEDPANKIVTWQIRDSRFEPWQETKVVYPSGPVVLYLNDTGKQAAIEDSSVIDILIEKGFRILAVDLRGTGESAPGHEDWHWDFMIGKPIFGQRVDDVRSCIQWLARPQLRADNVFIWAQGVNSLHAAFAATYDEGIAGMILEEPLTSFESVVSTRLPEYGDEILLPRILESFDIPQVLQAIAPHQVTVINPLLGDKTIAKKSDIKSAYSPVSDTYQALKQSSHWTIQSGVSGKQKDELILRAFEKMKSAGQ